MFSNSAAKPLIVSLNGGFITLTTAFRVDLKG